jgi:hypothetical protein
MQGACFWCGCGPARREKRVMKFAGSLMAQQFFLLAYALL